jgi:hypothetical protein
MMLAIGLTFVALSFLMTWSLCVAAKRGDEMMERKS